MVEFDLQKFLSEMQLENRTALQNLAKEVHDGFNEIRVASVQIAKDLVQHEKDDMAIQMGIETRLKAVEALAASAKWFLRTGIAAFITFVFDLILHHLGVKI